MSNKDNSLLQQKLQDLKQTVVELEGMVAEIPSVSFLIKKMLMNKILAVVPSLDVQGVYISRQGLGHDGVERGYGSVVDVFMQGLVHGYAPNYQDSIDGVYDRPGVYSDEFKIKGLSLTVIRGIVSKCIKDVPEEIRQYLGSYWQQSAGLDDQGRSRPSRISALRSCMAVHFWNEVAMTKLIRGISEENEARLNQVINSSGVPGPVYGVFLDTLQHGFQPLMHAFVVNLSGVVQAEINPEKDYYHYALYTAGRGIELFISSVDMHQELIRRASSIEGQAELIAELPLGVQAELRNPSRIRFQRINGNVISNGVTALLDKQKNDLYWLFGQLAAKTGDSTLLTSLDWKQQLGELLGQTRRRFVLLGERARKFERSQWFVRASIQQQQRFSDLEQALERDEAALQGMLGDVASLRKFSSEHVKRWAQSALGESIDPMQIKANTNHTFRLGKRTVIQKDSYPLADLVLYGLHDQGHRSHIVFKGSKLPAGLTQARFENWLGNQDVRSAYNQALRSRYSDRQVQSALIEVLGRRMALTLLGAELQYHISSDSKKLVERALLGDQSAVLMKPIIVGAKHALKDIVIYGQRNDRQGMCIVYAPNSPGGQAWHEFNSQKSFEHTLVGWIKSEEGRDYITRKSRPEDRVFIGEYLGRLEKKPTDWRGINVLESVGSIESVLKNIVISDIEFTLAEEETITAAGYRTSDLSQKQYFSRLTTELKALYVLGCNEAKLVSYEKFSYDLIKSRVEGILTKAGNYAGVDPDRVIIELENGEDISLAQLIIQERVIDFGGKNFVFPRFSLKSGPELRGLDIRHVISWSKTLRPGEKYIDMLKNVYLNESDTNYALKAEHHRSLQLHEMRKAALSERFQGRLSSSGYAKLVSSIESLSVAENDPNRLAFDYPDSPPREGVYHFHLEDRLVEGVYVFRSLESGQVKDLLYTPHAPDGKWLRPLQEFVVSVKHHGLGQYFYDRVLYKDQRVIGTYINNLEVSNSEQPTPKLRLNSRVIDFSKSYQEKIKHIISNVDEKTKSLGEIISGLVYDSVIMAASAISLVIPPVAFVVSAVVVAKGIVSGATAYNDGDRAEAFTFFRDAVIELATAGVGAMSGSSIMKGTLFSLIGDVNTVFGLFTSVTGQKVVGPARILELANELRQLAPFEGSSTTLK